MFRHFPQYITPGAKRPGTTDSSPDALAFKNPDGSIVTILYDSGSWDPSSTLYVSGANVQLSIPASGLATVKA